MTSKKKNAKNYLLFADLDEKLQYSSKICCVPEVLTKDTKELKINIGSYGSVPFATTNVQKDYADFESIIFVVWGILPECRIVLKFDELEWSKSFPIDYKVFEKSVSKELNKKSINTEIQHYMRFLYRIMNLKRSYNLFDVDESNKEELATFERIFSKASTEKKFKITHPETDSDIKITKSITENHLEKWFVLNTNKGDITHVIPEFSKVGSIVLYDQFPCGLFYETVNEKNRILNRGAFDLWGINDNEEICLFELKKKGNTGLGIISELFLYSCLIKDFKQFSISDNIGLEYKRGFDSFLKAKSDRIHAYFLVPKIHPFIKKHLDKIIEAMNNNRDKGIIYGCVEFDQTSVLNGKDEEEFIKSLNLEWNCR